MPKKTKTAKKDYSANKKAWRDKKIAAGLCGKCGSARDKHSCLCDPCNDKQKVYQTRYNHKIRASK